MIVIPSIEENFEKSLEHSLETFTIDLKEELKYFKGTKIVTLLDIYRIRKRLLPMLDVWLTSQEKSYKFLLKLHENLLFHALRFERSLSDITRMVNENKYVFRNGLKTLLNTLPESL